MGSSPRKWTGFAPGLAGLLLVLGGIGLAAALYRFNPALYSIYPRCQFHRLTGLNCPGCGGTRAVYALLHGDLLAALRDNALVVLGLAAAGLRGACFRLNRLRGRPNGPFFPARWLLPLLAGMLLFGIVRNLPAFAWLSPP